jgi:hypothetical protein
MRIKQRESNIITVNMRVTFKVGEDTGSRPTIKRPSNKEG